MASTAYAGYIIPATAMGYGSQSCSGYVMRGPAFYRYKLACLDASGARRSWESNVASTAEAPTAGVTLPYDQSTLTITGRF